MVGMEGFTKLGAGVAPTRSAPAVVDLAGLVDVVQVRVDVPALFVRRPVVVKNALAAGRPCPTEVLPPRHIAGGGPPITAMESPAWSMPSPSSDGRGHTASTRRRWCCRRVALAEVKTAVGLCLTPKLLDHGWRGFVPFRGTHPPCRRSWQPIRRVASSLSTTHTRAPTRRSRRN